MTTVLSSEVGVTLATVNIFSRILVWYYTFKKYVTLLRLCFVACKPRTWRPCEIVFWFVSDSNYWRPPEQGV